MARAANTSTRRVQRPSASGLARLPDGSVNVPKAAQRRMGIRTVLAPESEAAATVELPGRVVMDPNAGGRVQAVHGGRIEAGPKGLPVAGQAVKRGEVLAYVRHHAEPYALGNQQAQLAELRSQRALAEQRVQRLEGLEGTVPRKEIEAARAEAQSLQQREAQHRPQPGRARGAGGAGIAASSRVPTCSPARWSKRATCCSKWSIRRACWSRPPPPMPACRRASPAQAAGRAAGAQLELLGAARVLRDGVLPLTFTVRAEKPGTALPLAIGQPVTLIVALNERIKGFVLPAQAVVRNPANEPIVWIKSGAERFIPQPVQYRAAGRAARWS